MRQFFSARFWMAVAAVVGLALVAWLVVRDTGVKLVTPSKPATDEHRVDIVALVYAVTADANFAMVNDRSMGEMRLVIDGTRTMVIPDNTPGVISCHRQAELAKCVVAADLLGEAVLWFELIDAEPRATVVLAAVREIRDDGFVLLANGWEISHASVVERVCADDTSSLTDFIRKYGDRSTSTFDFDRQQIVKVTCNTATP